MVHKKSLRIILCGEDSFSSVVLESLISAGHQIVGVVIPEYDSNAYLRLAKECSGNNIPWIRCRNINSEEVVEWVRQKNPDIGVSAHFTKIIKKDLLSIPSMGFINLHPALLPYYRGATPQHWQIVNGERESAVTVHYINEGIDTGDIIVQERFLIDPEDYVSDLQKKWLKIYQYVVVDALDKIIAGDKPIKQPEIESPYYGILKPEDLILTDEIGTDEALGRIKGFSLPYDGARYGNLVIYRAEKITEPSDEILRMSSGIHRIENIGHILRTRDGALRILKSKEIKQ